MTAQELSGLDLFNGLFELCLIPPFAYGLYVLYKAKDSRALSGLEQWPYMLHCMYTVYFFAVLGRWYSAMALVAWSVAFIVKISMIWYYKPELPKPVFQAGSPTSRGITGEEA